MIVVEHKARQQQQSEDRMSHEEELHVLHFAIPFCHLVFERYFGRRIVFAGQKPIFEKEAKKN